MNAHIERLAREAGIEFEVTITGPYTNCGMDEIEAFARAIAEDCASMASEFAAQQGSPHSCAKAIRARYGVEG